MDVVQSPTHTLTHIYNHVTTECGSGAVYHQLQWYPVPRVPWALAVHAQAGHWGVCMRCRAPGARHVNDICETVCFGPAACLLTHVHLVV